MMWSWKVETNSDSGGKWRLAGRFLEGHMIGLVQIDHAHTD
jgi:hypothetical protein